MALTIAIEGRGVIANCDAVVDDTGGTGTGDWTEEGGGTMALSEDVFLVGVSCIGGKYAGKSGFQQFDIGAGNELNFTDSTGSESGELLYIWVAMTALGTLDTLSTYPLCIRLSSDSPGTSNYVDYLIAGNDDKNGWSGGFKCFIIDPLKTPSRVSGTHANIVAAVRTLGIWVDCSGSARADSIFIDQVAVGSGLRITGTSTTGWADVVTWCNDFTNRGWGMVQEREGIYYAYGKIYIGDSTQSAVTSFVDTSGPIIQFGTSEYYYSAAWVPSVDTDFGGIIIEDHADYTTTFDDGIIVGTAGGRAGSYYIGHDDLFVSADLFGGAATGSLTRLYGTTLRNFRGAVNMGDDSQHLFYGGTINGCGQFDPVAGPILRNITFANSATTGGYDAALKWNSNIDIEDCSFLANEYGIEHDTAASGVNYTNLIFSGQTEYDILFTDTGVLEVLVDGGTIPTWSGTAGGTVSLPSSITLTMTVKDEAGDPIDVALVYIDDDDEVPYILSTTTNAQGVASTGYTGGAAAGSRWRVRKYGYKPYKQIIDIGASDISIPVTLISDPQQT